MIPPATKEKNVFNCLLRIIIIIITVMIILCRISEKKLFLFLGSSESSSRTSTKKSSRFIFFCNVIRSKQLMFFYLFGPTYLVMISRCRIIKIYNFSVKKITFCLLSFFGLVMAAPKLGAFRHTLLYYLLQLSR